MAVSTIIVTESKSEEGTVDKISMLSYNNRFLHSRC
nr:MAG TPA: hypothetical protein [Caudoviricetes sp.]